MCVGIIYRITGNSRDRKHSRISRFVDHSRIFSSKSFHLIKRIELTATNIANGFEEDSTRECFLANGLNIEDSRMFSVARISRYTVLVLLIILICSNKHSYRFYMRVHSCWLTNFMKQLMADCKFCRIPYSIYIFSYFS